MSHHGPRTWVIAYDIRCPRRLGRVARVCMRNAIRLQKSLYQTTQTEAGIRQLAEQLRRLIDEGEDDIRIYAPAEREAITWIGAAPFDDGVLYSGLTMTDDGPHHFPTAPHLSKGPRKSLKLGRKRSPAVRTKP